MQRLLSIGQLIDHTWDAYRHRFFGWMNISCWTLVGLILMLVALAFYPTVSRVGVSEALAQTSQFTNLEGFGILLYGFATILVAPALGILIFNALVLAGRYPTQPLSFIWKSAREQFWSVIWIVVLYTAITVGILFGGMLPGALLLLTTSLMAQPPALLSLFGGIILVAGGAIGFLYFTKWTVWYSFAPYLVLLQGKKGAQALMASKALVVGRFWPVFLRLMVPKMLCIVVLVVAIQCGYLALEVVSYPLTSLLSWNRDLLLRIAVMLEQITPVLPSILIHPFFILADVILIQDLTNGTWNERPNSRS